MRWLNSLVAVGFVSFTVMACGDDDESTDSAVEKCEDFLTVVCERTVECAPARTEDGQPVAPAVQLESCLSAGRASTPCGNAVRVSSSYDQCIQEVLGASCSVIADPEADPPDSCTNIILSP